MSSREMSPAAESIMSRTNGSVRQEGNRERPFRYEHGRFGRTQMVGRSWSCEELTSIRDPTDVGACRGLCGAPVESRATLSAGTSERRLSIPGTRHDWRASWVMIESLRKSEPRSD